jgi:hypothetical protein
VKQYGQAFVNELELENALYVPSFSLSLVSEVSMRLLLNAVGAALTLIATCQNSGTAQPHEHGCEMHDTRNIFDTTTTSNRENHL